MNKLSSLNNKLLCCISATLAAIAGCLILENSLSLFFGHLVFIARRNERLKPTCYPHSNNNNGQRQIQSLRLIILVLQSSKTANIRVSPIAGCQAAIFTNSGLLIHQLFQPTGVCSKEKAPFGMGDVIIWSLFVHMYGLPWVPTLFPAACTHKQSLPSSRLCAFSLKPPSCDAAPRRRIHRHPRPFPPCMVGCSKHQTNTLCHQEPAVPAFTQLRNQQHASYNLFF